MFVYPISDPCSPKQAEEAISQVLNVKKFRARGQTRREQMRIAPMGYADYLNGGLKARISGENHTRVTCVTGGVRISGRSLVPSD